MGKTTQKLNEAKAFKIFEGESPTIIELVGYDNPGTLIVKNQSDERIDLKITNLKGGDELIVDIGAGSMAVAKTEPNKGYRLNLSENNTKGKLAWGTYQVILE